MARQHTAALIHGRVAQRFGLNATAMAVLLAYAFYANRETGLAFPAQTTVAEVVGCSPRTVANQLRKLIAAGLMVPVEPSRRGKIGTYLLPLGSERDSEPGNADANVVPFSAKREKRNRRPENGTSYAKNRTTFTPTGRLNRQEEDLCQECAGHGTVWQNEHGQPVAYDALDAAAGRPCPVCNTATRRAR